MKVTLRRFIAWAPHHFKAHGMRYIVWPHALFTDVRVQCIYQLFISLDTDVRRHNVVLLLEARVANAKNCDAQARRYIILVLQAMHL
jgi:hypothetical protein